MVRPGRIRFKFSRSARLSRASEFRLVKASGKSWTGKHLVLAILARENGSCVQNRNHCHEAAGKRGLPKPGPEKNQGNIQIESAPHSKRVLACYDRSSLLGHRHLRRAPTRLVAADGARLYFSAWLTWRASSGSYLKCTKRLYHRS